MKFKLNSFLYINLIPLSILLCVGNVVGQERNLAQNLVPNGDFELGRKNSKSIKPWRFTNTVDVFNKVRGAYPGRTSKWNLPAPHSGNKYVGIRIERNYREYIQIKLDKPLSKGEKYYFEMWVCPSEDVPYKSINLGASFEIRKVAYTYDGNLYKHPPSIVLKRTNGIKGIGPNQWLKIGGVYRAKGGERYLTIGDFTINKNEKQLKAKNWYNFLLFHYESYYFIDSVVLYKIPDIKENQSLVKTIDNTDIENIAEDSVDFDMSKENYVYNIENQTSITLNKVNFEFGSDKLLASSYNDLELVLEYLNQNENAKIKIIGYTDNVGSAADNLKLSERRAKAVYNFFIKFKIDKDRLEYLGKGEDDPIDTNSTPIGRKKNRRVEIELLK